MGKIESTKHTKVCPSCNVTFVTTSKKKKYCSSACRHALFNKKSPVVYDRVIGKAIRVKAQNNNEMGASSV